MADCGGRLAAARTDFDLTAFSTGRHGGGRLPQRIVRWLQLIVGWLRLIVGWLRLIVGWLRLIVGWLRLIVGWLQVIVCCS